jgi:hypothetical protein
MLLCQLELQMKAGELPLRGCPVLCLWRSAVEMSVTQSRCSSLFHGVKALSILFIRAGVDDKMLALAGKVDTAFESHQTSAYQGEQDEIRFRQRRRKRRAGQRKGFSWRQGL